MGIFSGFLGLITTLAALNIFTDDCFNQLNGNNNIYLEKHLGIAFYCLLFATILKGIDLIVHCMIPVPIQGYWGQTKFNTNEYDEMLLKVINYYYI